MVEVSAVNVREGGERGTNNLLSYSQDALEGLTTEQTPYHTVNFCLKHQGSQSLTALVRTIF